MVIGFITEQWFGRKQDVATPERVYTLETSAVLETSFNRR